MCNVFLEKVAYELGGPHELGGPIFTGHANDMIARLEKSPSWFQLGRDPVRAVRLAAQGYLVIAGRVEIPNGHVAVVVPGWSPTGHPMGYWGQLHGSGAADHSLSDAWIPESKWNMPKVQVKHPHKLGTPAPLDEVLYFARYLRRLAPTPKQ